jgi:DNA-binding protein HU-beta
MNKSDLIEKVAKEAGISKREAAKAINATLKVISEEIAKDKQVALAGFGTFKKSARVARFGRNPRTGEVVPIKASQSASFKPSAALKNIIGGPTGGGGPGKKK